MAGVQVFINGAVVRESMRYVGETTILLTGFEPFGGNEDNPSAAIVEALQGTRCGEAQIDGLILPVDTQTAPNLLLEYLNDSHAAIVTLGLAEGRHVISLERVAVNILDFSIPDNAGNLRSGEPVVAGGPAAYFSTLPLRHIFAAIAEAGVPVALSETAGTYLCNQLMYAVQHALQSQDARRRPMAGFIHVPATPQMIAKRITQAAKSDNPLTMYSQRLPPTMNLADQITAITAALTVIAAEIRAQQE